MRMMPICSAMIAPAIRPTARSCARPDRSRASGAGAISATLTFNATPAFPLAGRSPAVVRPADDPAFELGERHERQGRPLIDVGPRDRERAARRLLLDD